MSNNDKGVIAPLAVVSALRGLGTSVLMTFLPVYAVCIGLSLPDIGIVSTIAMGISVMLIPLAGITVDLLGKKTVLFISTLMLSMASIIPFLIEDFLGVLIAYILFHSALNIWIPARAATVAGTISENIMGRSFAILSLSFQISRVIAPYIAGIFIKNYGYSPVFMTASIVVASSSIIIVLFIPEQKSSERLSLSGLLKGITPRREELGFHIFLCMDRSGWRLWTPILNSYMKVHLGLGEDIIGFMSTLRGVTSMLGVVPSGILVDKYGWIPAILASEVTGALAALTIAFARSDELVVLAMCLIGLSIALWSPSFNVAIPNIVPIKSELGRTYARSNLYRSIAAIPAPWLGGMLYDITPALPMTIGAIVLFINIGILASIVRKYRKKNTMTGFPRKPSGPHLS